MNFMEYILTVINGKTTVMLKGCIDWYQDRKLIVATITYSNLPCRECSSAIFAPIYPFKLQSKA